MTLLGEQAVRALSSAVRDAMNDDRPLSAAHVFCKLIDFLSAYAVLNKSALDAALSRVDAACISIETAQRSIETLLIESQQLASASDANIVRPIDLLRASAAAMPLEIENALRESSSTSDVLQRAEACNALVIDSPIPIERDEEKRFAVVVRGRSGIDESNTYATLPHALVALAHLRRKAFGQGPPPRFIDDTYIPIFFTRAMLADAEAIYIREL